MSSRHTVRGVEIIARPVLAGDLAERIAEGSDRFTTLPVRVSPDDLVEGLPVRDPSELEPVDAEREWLMRFGLAGL